MENIYLFIFQMQSYYNHDLNDSALQFFFQVVDKFYSNKINLSGHWFTELNFKLKSTFHISTLAAQQKKLIRNSLPLNDFSI